MADRLDVFDRTARNNPVFDIVIRICRYGSIDGGHVFRSIFRMNTLQPLLPIGHAVLGVEPIDAIPLLGEMQRLLTRYPPAPAPGMCESLRFRQITFAPLQSVLRQFVLDSHTREVRNLSDDLLVTWTGTSWFPIVHGKSSNHFAFRGKDGRRPTGLQRIRLRKLTKIAPQWIVGDIGDDHLLAKVSCGSAGTHGRTNLASIDGIGISLRQAGCSTVPQL